MFNSKRSKFIELPLYLISTLSILIPLISAGILYRHMDKTLKRLSVFILFSAITETLAIIYFENVWNNIWISHLYAFVQVPLLTWIYSSFIVGVRRKLIVFSCIAFLLFSIINLVFWEGLMDFNSNQRYFAAVVILMFCSFYFIQVFVEAKVVRIELEYRFWMSASILIYMAGTLFLFILREELLKMIDDDYWDLNCILNIILNLGLTASLWMGTKKLN